MIATIGIKTKALPTYAITNKKIITKGKSITDKIVAEVIKSRMLSKSLRLLANAPIETGRLTNFIPMTRSKILAEIKISDFFPAISTKYPLNILMMKSNI